MKSRGNRACNIERHHDSELILRDKIKAMSEAGDFAETYKVCNRQYPAVSTVRYLEAFNFVEKSKVGCTQVERVGCSRSGRRRRCSKRGSGSPAREE